MPLIDLSYITRAYIELLSRGFATSPAWGAALPQIWPVPPASLTSDGISFYLYHVLQKKEYDNFPVPTRQPEAKFLPMALTLYYQLTANSTAQDENSAYNEQLMMSIAMKALHDCPLIDDTTMVDLTPGNPTPIMPPAIQGLDNRFRIVQQPIPYNEAVHNWTAGQASLKLSAFYEVSPVFLEPDTLTAYTGRVLTYGNYIFLKGAPRITASRSTIEYTAPGDTVARQIKVQPAQAIPAKDPPAVVTGNSVVSFYGEGFNGDNIQLRLLNTRWPEPVIASVDWGIAVAGIDTLTATIREKAVAEKDGAPVDLLPGMYAAQVIVERFMPLPDGGSRSFRSSSNQFPFLIAPRIDPVGLPVGSIVTITGYLFRFMVGPDDLLIDSIDVYIGEVRMNRKDTGVFSEGQFRVINPTTMEINLPGPLSSGMHLPLRILINGAESLPNWIII